MWVRGNSVPTRVNKLLCSRQILAIKESASSKSCRNAFGVKRRLTVCGETHILKIPRGSQLAGKWIPQFFLAGYPLALA